MRRALRPRVRIAVGRGLGVPLVKIPVEHPRWFKGTIESTILQAQVASF